MIHSYFYSPTFQGGVGLYRWRVEQLCKTNTDAKFRRGLSGRLPVILHAAPVKLPEKPTTLLLNSAVDLMFEIYLMRGDCSVLAKSLVEQRKLDDTALEECARLDDTLAQAYKGLQATLKTIQRARVARRKKLK